LLPDHYSPLQPNGNGIQSVYLTELSSELFGALILLIGAEASHLREVAPSIPLQDRQVVGADMELWEHHLEREIDNVLSPMDIRLRMSSPDLRMDRCVFNEGG
jgi:putative restriction endonuclease